MPWPLSKPVFKHTKVKGLASVLRYNFVLGRSKRAAPARRKTMKEDVRIIIYVVGTTIANFVTAYFAVAALFPVFALQAGLIAAMGAVIWYLFLFITENDRGGLPLGCMIIMPVIYAAAGLIWWILRLIGLWPLPVR